MNRYKGGVATMLLVMPALALAEIDHGSAATKKLQVGDPAPALTPDKWIKGEPLRQFELGKIYVIEFWATWCPPCRASIPHLTELQARFQRDGVIVIGQNCWEDHPEKVTDFVAKMGDKMNYRVAMDGTRTGNQDTMSKTWMQAAGQRGIPTAFVVDKQNRIAWIGHPMSGLDRVIAKIVAGTFDAKQEAELAGKVKTKQQELNGALKEKRWDDALKAVAELEQLNPNSASRSQMTRFNIFLQKKDYATAYGMGARLAEALKDDPSALNGVAWSIATEDGIERRDLDLAEKLASRANEITKGEEPSILDTLARVYFEKGNIPKAIELETQAVARADDDLKMNLQNILDKYKEGAKNKF